MPPWLLLTPSASYLFGNEIYTSINPADFSTCIDLCTDTSNCFGTVYNNATTPSTCTLKQRYAFRNKDKRDVDETSGRPGTFVALRLYDPSNQTPLVTSYVSSSTATPTVSVTSKSRKSRTKSFDG